MEKSKKTITNQPLWHVTFQQNDFVVKVFTDIPNFETAVKLSLSLHEASNVTHNIYVMHGDIIDVVFNRP